MNVGGGKVSAPTLRKAGVASEGGGISGAGCPGFLRMMRRGIVVGRDIRPREVPGSGKEEAVARQREKIAAGRDGTRRTGETV
jgi:hypothetical protein